MARLGPDEGEAMKAVVAAADLVRVRVRVRVWARVRARARARARGPRLGLGLLGLLYSLPPHGQRRRRATRRWARLDVRGG